MKHFIATSVNCIVVISSCIVLLVVYILFNSFLTEIKKESVNPVSIDSTGWCGGPSYSEKELAGRHLFNNNCAACHNKDMKSKLTGPALGGVTLRWSAHPKEDLYRWIRNSQEMIGEGHPKAEELWDEWKPTVMNSFPRLTDEELESLLSYIETASGH